jgi:hypothetical protein
MADLFPNLPPLTHVRNLINNTQPQPVQPPQPSEEEAQAETNPQDQGE